jgi:Carboxypeptidase regulatory-like domain
VTREVTIAASPIWIRLQDTFTGEPPSGPVVVSLERRDGPRWIPFPYPHLLSRAGDLAFLNLGRTRDPGAVGSFDVRVTVTSPHTVAESITGDPDLVITVTAWAPDAPVTPQSPDNLRLFPGPSYHFPPGTPVLAGRVVDAAGVPVARARVWATETIQNAQVVEEVRTGGDGRFRLPLRWSAGATDVHARRGLSSGAITVTVPTDLSSTQQITLT